MKTTKSPCIDVCAFVAPNGWCTGCGRTQAECQQWKKMKPYTKQMLEKVLKKRLLPMNVAK